MRRNVLGLIFSGLLCFTLTAAAQPGQPNKPVFTGLPEKVVKSTQRLVHGQVLDLADNPLEKAVVHLTEKKTKKVTSVTTGRNGEFRFPGLDLNQDYELKAEREGSISTTRLISMLDPRKDVTLNLKIEPKKLDEKKGDGKTPADSKSPEKKPDDTKKPTEDKKPGL